MKKRMMIIMAAGFVVALGITAAAVFSGGEIGLPIFSEQPQGEQLETRMETRLAQPLEARVAVIRQSLTNEDFISLLRTQGYYEDEINQVMVKFINTAALYGFSEEELRAVYEMTQAGRNLSKLMDIYDFTKNTHRPADLEFVKELYDRDAALRTYGRNWIEDAFNSLTKERGGVLNEEEIGQYIGQGLSVSEISLANTLSRKGIKTIQEILQERLNGGDWTAIMNAIYPSKALLTDSLPPETQPEQLYQAVVTSDITGVSVQQILNGSQEAQTVLYNVQKEAGALMDELQISETITPAVVEAAKEKLPELQEKTIRQALERGASIRELEEKKQQAEEQGIPAAVMFGEKEVR